MATAKMFASAPANALGSTASGGANIDYGSDTIKVMMSTSTYTPNQTTHTIKSDVTNEVSGTGYTAGGVTLGSKAVNISSLTVMWDAADATWTTASFSAANAVVYDDTVATPVKPLISYVDFGGTQTVSAADFTIIWNASGIWQVTVT